MNQDQLNSLVRSLLKIAGAILMQHGLTTQAAWINSPDVCGLVVLLVGIWMSHQNHAAAAPIDNVPSQAPGTATPAAGSVVPQPPASAPLPPAPGFAPRAIGAVNALAGVAQTSESAVSPISKSAPARPDEPQRVTDPRSDNPAAS